MPILPERAAVECVFLPSCGICAATRIDGGTEAIRGSGGRCGPSDAAEAGCGPATGGGNAGGARRGGAVASAEGCMRELRSAARFAGCGATEATGAEEGAMIGRLADLGACLILITGPATGQLINIRSERQIWSDQFGCPRYRPRPRLGDLQTRGRPSLRDEPAELPLGIGLEGLRAGQGPMG
jgi:hypothetical protein